MLIPMNILYQTQAYTLEEFDSYISLKEKVSRNVNIPVDVFYLTDGVNIIRPESDLSSLTNSTLDVIIPCPAGSLVYIILYYYIIASYSNSFIHFSLQHSQNKPSLYIKCVEKSFG